MADRRSTLTARGRAVVTVLVAVLFIAGAAVVLGLTAGDPSTTSPTPTPTPTEPPPDPIDAAVTVADVDNGTMLLGDSVEDVLSQAMDALVERAPVVVVGDDEPALVLARDLQLPLLPTSMPDLSATLDRLDTTLVLTAGVELAPRPIQPGVDRTATETVSPDLVPDVTHDPDPTSPVLDVGGREVREVWIDGDRPDPDALTGIAFTAPVPSAAVLLVPADDPARELLVILSDAAGATTVSFEGSLVDDPDAGEMLRGAGDGPWAAVGTHDAWAFQAMDTLSWDVDVVRAGVELPGGGYRMFPDRLFIALYGSPGVPSLGVMGQQDLEGAIERAQVVAGDYVELVDVPVVPTFEIITTIASRDPEGGDYSRRVPHDRILPWIEAAADAGLYVILDLQPGRTDFLTQAKEVENLLAYPHVGLALDPEWRLLPNQVHLRQIGFVSVEEVQEVADWLAEFTRERGLPQKMLLLHQFRLSMLPNLGDLVVPPELGVAVQMDGQGSQPAKDETWRALTTMQAVPDDLWFGWKNFYREDTTVRSPADTVAVEPRPVLVSYQ